MNLRALTKIQSIILIAIIVVAAVGSGTVYVMLAGEEPNSETIKIGVLSDLDMAYGKETYEGVILAAEQLNAEGGLLGKQIKVIGEDDDGGLDPTITSTALNRLITVDNVDFIIGMGSLTIQEIIAEHKKIFLAVLGEDAVCQQVLDNYEKYKYYFICTWNNTATFLGVINGLEALKQNTGFTKIGIIGNDFTWMQNMIDILDSFLPQKGFEVVYKNTFPLGTMDFSSYFAAAEAAGVENMLTLIGTDDYIPFVKEYYDRQSPMFIFGGILGDLAIPEAWGYTDGKCEAVSAVGMAVAAGYPLTSKTLATKQAFIDRDFESPTTALGYDIMRFILADAIRRAGTIKTEAVIKALEETNVETSGAKNFVFTMSHGVMMGTDANDPEANYMIVLYFQWQNGELVPVYPQKIMEEVGATYTYPDWPGPWDKIS